MIFAPFVFLSNCSAIFYFTFASGFAKTVFSWLHFRLTSVLFSKTIADTNIHKLARQVTTVKLKMVYFAALISYYLCLTANCAGTKAAIKELVESE